MDLEQRDIFLLPYSIVTQTKYGFSLRYPDFTVDGMEDPRWWARWLLWNKLSISAAKKDVEQRFGIEFI
jgi:hypothetical protein